MQFNPSAPLIDLPEAEWRLWCINNWPYQNSIQFSIPIGTFTENSPSAGYVAWSDVIVEYGGNQYVITNGNTNKKWIYWDQAASSVFAASDTFPSLAADMTIVGNNVGGEYTIAWKSGQGLQANIASGSILSDADLILSCFSDADSVIVYRGNFTNEILRISSAGIVINEGEIDMRATPATGILLKNPDGTITKRVRLNEDGTELIIENIV